MNWYGKFRIFAPTTRCGTYFFDEVETDDPVRYVRDFLSGKTVEISVDEKPGGAVTVYAVCDGLQQTFIFSPIG